MSRNRPVKWGHLHEIDNRCKVGTPAWKARHPRRVQHLSAYRRLHDIADHDTVRDIVDAPVSAKLKKIREIENGE